ncbi:hypothetical protein EV210_106218 [Anaerospora hongkongensis]|uniref:Uncharacterized protein n=1 Tax=Anaerospora hongkongensis TaxID=244830 RepID=A0A4R1PXJ1_9FIRM|nr:hypothetical protein [Anaerospora hongkongensis]TCL37349.1 hypothetical protein EV210_106218 [Anaerospora hongkongensis]
MEKKPYADVWGDTVDLKHLAIAMGIGIIISLLFYILGLNYLQANFSKLAANLMTAYALLIGIAGCLLSAIISAKLFKPKRKLNEEEFSEGDRLAVLEELKIDIDKEAEELQFVGPKVIQEMKDLQIYDLFARKNPKSKVGEVQDGRTVSQ